MQEEINEWLTRVELLWRQKSRETWLKEGDKNSIFFHLSTIIRRKRNSIDAIKDDRHMDYGKKGDKRNVLKQV